MQRTTTPYTLLFLLLAVCLSSCSRRYKVEGLSSVTALEGKTLYLKVLENGEWTAVDSAEMVHGLFRMEGPADSARMVTLYLDEECIMPLVLENGTVKVTLTNSQFIAQGTPLNDALYEFIEKRNQMERCLGDLERKSIRLAMSGLARQEDLERLKKEKHRKKQEMEAYVRTFIADNYENVLGPSVFMMFCCALPYPILTPQAEGILKDAPESFKENALVKDFVTKAHSNMQILEKHQCTDPFSPHIQIASLP